MNRGIFSRAKNARRLGLFVDRGQAVLVEAAPSAVRVASFSITPGAPTETAAALRRLIREKEFESRSVNICLPHRLAAIKSIRVPSTDPDEIRSMATLQACRLMPFSPEEIIAGFEIVQTSAEGFSTVLLTVVRREDVDPILDICRRDGLRVNQVMLDSHALPALAADQVRSPCLLVTGEDQEGMVAILDKNNSRFARAFPWDGSADSLAHEAAMSLDAYQKDTPFWTPSKILWVGKTPSGEIRKALESVLNAPFDVFEFPAQLHESWERSAYSAACAQKVPTNLLPDTEQKRQGRETLARQKMIFASLFLSIVFAWVGLGWMQEQRQRARIARLDQTMAALSREAQGLEAKADRLEETRRSEGASLLQDLRALNAVLPSGVSLSGLSYERHGAVVLQGEALSLADALATVTALEKSALFQKVELRNSDATTINGKDLAQFQIVCEPMAGGK